MPKRSKKSKKLTYTQYARAIAHVSMTVFRLSPSAGIVQLLDSIIRAILPIATTYFAALTTTALADAYTGNEQAAQHVFWYVLATSGISVVMLLWTSMSSYVEQKTRYVIEAAVEDRMKLHFGSLPFALYDDKEVIDLKEKAERFSRVFGYIFNTIGSMIVSIVSAIGSVTALMFVNVWLGTIVFLVVLPGVVIQLRLAREQTRHWEGNITNRRRMSSLSWLVSDSRSMAEMRVYGVLKNLITEYRRLRERDEKERLQLELRTIWKQTVAEIGQAIVELGALVWVVMQIIDRSQPVGQFLFVQQMVGRAIGNADTLARQLGRADEDLANLVDYQRFMEIAGDTIRPHTLRDTPRRIELCDVSFTYPKTDKSVLENINLTIESGQHVAIVGENGAGKSTLVKLIMGLYEPTSGRVLVDGKNLVEVQPESWHRYIALLVQDFVSYHFATINENITLGNVDREPERQKITQAMKYAKFDDVVKGLEHGGDTYINRWMSEDNDEATATDLSGGQYQRLALARNFYRDSPIIILDEPTSAIDALAESRIFSHLFAQKDKTLIMISHRLTTIEKADIIYMFERGKIVEQGTHKELVTQKGAYYRMFKSQLHE